MWNIFKWKNNMVFNDEVNVKKLINKNKKNAS